MMLNLPQNLETALNRLVQSGRYLTVDEALAAAARLLLDQQASFDESTAKAAFREHLIESGLMIRLPDLAADRDDPDDQPIFVSGEALSETVIRERR